jgi:hypothetical protein
MTNNEAHAKSIKHLARTAMKPSARRKLEAAEAAGDWATVAEMLGENVGTN